MTNDLLVLTNITVGVPGAGGATPAWSGLQSGSGGWFTARDLPPAGGVLRDIFGRFLARGDDSVKLILATAWVNAHWLLLLLFVRPGVGQGGGSGGGGSGGGGGTIHPLIIDSLSDAHGHTSPARGASCVAQLRGELGFGESPGKDAAGGGQVGGKESSGAWEWQPPHLLPTRPQPQGWECGYFVCARADVVLRAWCGASAVAGAGVPRNTERMSGECISAAAAGGGRWFGGVGGNGERDTRGGDRDTRGGDTRGGDAWWAPGWGTKGDLDLFVAEVVGRERG